MTEGNAEHFDIVVIGGGPGGSTAASFAAMDGHRVLLLERDSFPRYQIGESLLPATVHGICKMLGVWEKVEAAGFMRKRGGTFRWGKDPTPWTFAFSSSPTFHGAGYAYQVERSRFDKILLDNAREKGVEVRERCLVLDVIQESGRTVGVRYTDQSGVEHAVRSRFVVDASGNAGHLHSRVGERVFSKFFQNVALFCYFENGKRLPPPNSGNILSAAFSEGWFWYIPLSDTLTSVGAVIAREHAERIKDGHEAAMNGFIRSCPIIADYLADAVRVKGGPYGQFRVRKDYSYSNTRFWGPGLVLVGDTACFIDPVFSSGVHLATYSALLAARSMNTCLRGEIDETRCFEEFENRYRREYGLFYDFLLSFYDMHQDLDSYYWKARKILSTEERGNEAFVRLVGGGGTAADDFFRDRASLGRGADALAQKAAKEDSASPGFLVGADTSLRLKERFVESAHIMAHAGSTDAPPDELPILPGGLVPSADGYRWRLAASPE